ncbi:MAG: pyruvate carboxylase subunit B, partial [Methylococcales bacterium]
LPLHLHCHATSGLSEMCQLKAIEAGCQHVDTALSSWAGGTSHPPTESLVTALRGTDYDTGLDLDKLQAVNHYFAEVRKKYRRYESEFTGIDTQVHVFQVPGGMISNLANQLKERNALDRMAEVYKEIPLVRKDLGYPLVTPTSQIVGTQAVLNVLTGKRYETITNEVKRYLQGGYGKAPAPVSSELRNKAIGNEEVMDCRPADLLKPEFAHLREEIGTLALNDEDVLSFAMFPEVGKLFLEQRAANTLVPEPLELEDVSQNAVKKAPTEFNVALHGESYHVKVTGAGPKNETLRHFYFMVDGVPEDIVVETLDEIVLDGGTQGAVQSNISSKRAKPSAEGDVVVNMPCNVLEVLVKVGQQVAAGQAVLITEAMKMETEVTAPIAGIVKAVHVVKGEPANPDEVLIEIVAA